MFFFSTYRKDEVSLASSVPEKRVSLRWSWFLVPRIAGQKCQSIYTNTHTNRISLYISDDKKFPDYDWPLINQVILTLLRIKKLVLISEEKRYF